jgi:hypothetical protein
MPDCEHGPKGQAVTRNIFLLSAVAFAYLLARHWEERPIVHPPGVLVPQSPLQVDQEPTQFEMDGYLLTRRAKFETRARVLSTRNYYLRRESDLSPVDLALGWGPMSDQAVLDRIDISQSSRWYRTRYEFPAPLPDQQIIHYSSNMHMIPAGSGVKKILKQLRHGDLVTLRGHLVDVDHGSGWAWRTSMSRDDTGSGACEIVFVESIVVDS